MGYGLEIQLVSQVLLDLMVGCVANQLLVSLDVDGCAGDHYYWQWTGYAEQEHVCVGLQSNLHQERVLFELCWLVRGVEKDSSLFAVSLFYLLDVNGQVGWGQLEGIRVELDSEVLNYRLVTEKVMLDLFSRVRSRYILS